MRLRECLAAPCVLALAVPHRGALPAPSRLPSLPAALQRRAAVFGLVEADPPPAAFPRARRGIVAALRRVADALDPRGLS